MKRTYYKKNNPHRNRHLPGGRKRTMKYQIDQSGKIEQTSKSTVIALANGKTITIKITAVEKQKLIKTMFELCYPKKIYIYQIFAALIYLLLRETKTTELTIDKEYPGHEPDIKLFLLQLFQKTRKQSPEFHFGYVGKKSNAHKAGINVFNKKLKPDIVAKAEDVLRLLYTKEKGWRSRSSRDNP